VFTNPFDSFNEAGEPAAEAASGHLIRVDSTFVYELGVYQFRTLVVQNGGGFKAAGMKHARSREDESRLPRPEKSTQRDQHWSLVHGITPKHDEITACQLLKKNSQSACNQ
jgi:hypothetical protein